MKNLELSIDRELDFMIKYQLDANELFVLKMIFYAQNEHEEFLNKYFSECKAMDLRNVLVSLQSKELINKTYKIPEKGSRFIASEVNLNKNLIKDYLRHSQELGTDLLMAYPAFTTINGKTFSLRNITKLYKSLDDFSWHYGKTIGFSPTKHKEVMDLLEWAKENNHIHSGICDFVASQQWITIQEIKDEGSTVFDTMEAL